jgi:2-C-methyl-D-erythritol 4-phosphate cytidylyltransferase
VAVVGVLAAGGSGERLGAGEPKALVVLAGRPMLEWSLDVLRATCDRVVVAVPAELVDDGPGRVAGGASRSASVRNALGAEDAAAASVVVVHDAARPLVEAELVRRCIAALADADGAIAAAPVTDTIKQADTGLRVTGTLDRSRLWAVQTPQVFRADALREALAVDDETLAGATDDAGLVERAGGSVVVVAAPPENLKVTTALDLAVAEAILAERGC